MVLISHVNALENLRIQFLDPYRNDPYRERSMIMFSQEGAHLAINYDSLAFLLTTEFSNLLLEINVAERSYQSAMASLALRNVAFEKFHGAGKLIEADEKTGTCKIATDPRDLRFLKDTTDALYQISDSAVVKCDNAVKGLKAAGKSVFPKRKFLSFEDKK